MVGINHTDSQLATYSNVAIYSAKDKRGVKSETDDKYRGSATTYLPHNPDAALMYVHEFSRDCGERKQRTPIGTGELEVAPDDMVVLTERAYLHPTIHVGATAGALLPAKILVARKRAAKK